MNTRIVLKVMQNEFTKNVIPMKSSKIIMLNYIQQSIHNGIFAFYSCYYCYTIVLY